MRWVPFWPRASALSGESVNTLFIAELVVCAAILLLVFGLIWVFCIRYRRGNPVSRSGPEAKSWVVEIAWTAGTLLAFLVLFAWGAEIYVWLYKPPPAADLELYVVGKQWMWKMQHPGGQREIDELHVPVGRPIKLIMTSQDVIHSFGIPAFRITQDVLPGSYTTQWFTAAKTGEYHLFCREYCGTAHSQ